MECDHSPRTPPVDGEALAEDLGQELECGCCSGLIYKPVVVNPCEHFFCGSCCVLWIRNGGTNCPKCRGPSSSIVPSKPLQVIADVLARADPSRARSERERAQADDVYPEPRCLKFPAPREPSPEPTIPSTTDFLRPCPHCSPGNAFNYVCPIPIVDPDVDVQNAWPLEDGAPDGHAFCGNCENVLSLQAPQTTKCDFCQVSFCGINIANRCIAHPLTSQHPHNMSDVGDLIQSAEVYDCFDGNTVEVDFMLDHMTAQGYTPRHVYREIVQSFSSKPNGFAPMFDADLFTDIHNVSPGGPDPNPSAPRQKICRLCASEVMLYGLRDWWIEERRKGFLEGPMVDRKDCPDGRHCRKQQDLGS
ncbi:hypothetical protein SCHPADRAFT_822691 [Schizopora paradoxa]|uniref:RING-type domain-containing protein n=1 Tax=Schizopora paradoxa TaxID=27342 RepID=A0A0H2RXC0_9AGAM|nr:hypothetical protein SCHPADRAFT_822691 [Schizopora paradoxa]